MPEQPQWSERTLDMPPQDPWAEPPTMPAPAVPHAGDPTRVQRPHGSVPPAPQDGERTRVQPPPGASAAVPPGASAAVPWGASAAVPPGASAAVPPGGEPTRAQVPHGPVSPAPQSAPPSPFSRGRAQVTPRPERHDHTAEHEPTGTGWPGAEAPRPQHSLDWHLRRLRRGGEWSTAAVLFAFVCWGIWALSAGGSLGTPVVAFVVTLLVAAGVFALCRLVGQLVLERQLGRTRHTARGSHMVAGLFLVGAGFTFLQQTAWVMDAVNWVKDVF
ncbi:DNA-directed RNA polymerase II [Actinoplanes teichomyceticus]|uniref:Uncharacterized protein n=1 Tax=Actinoplanes teichomyceticus TaxID=1867 RepID=A0A561VG00_ACTTI|nr:DNA-directed RNA polymerase II [Actinoplanes teichomyceticus]TWG10531.1 hypothetical protein FHX34_10721 [Actinoplanes teichomyceticus]GIF15303.1 hypothetical protein Ate01nite_53350 [Actinoplanes teichomyceticus]